MSDMAMPRCLERGCIHFIGEVVGVEPNQTVTCEAFPQGIPFTIAYGKDRHLTKHPEQDNDIVYEGPDR